MKHTLPDGVVVDLDHPLSDVFGTEWHWTKRRDGGQPLMSSDTQFRHAPPVPLDDVHELFGPLRELPPQSDAKPTRRVIPRLPVRTRRAIPGGWSL